MGTGPNRDGIDIPVQPEVPTIVHDFPYATMQEAYDVYWNNNSLPRPTPPERGFQTQEELDAFRAEDERIIAHNQAVNENFKLDVQDPYTQAVDNYNIQADNYVQDYNRFMQVLARTSTPESLNNVLENVDPETQTYDFSRLDLIDAEDYSFNLPNVGTTNRGRYILSDFTPSADEIFGETFVTKRGITPDHLTQKAYISDKKISKGVLTEAGEAWFAENIDAGEDGALSLLTKTTVDPVTGETQTLSLVQVMDQAMSDLNAIGGTPAEAIRRKSDAINTLAELLEIRTPKGLRDMSDAERRDLMDEINLRYSEVKEEVARTGTPYTEAQLKKARETVWLRKLTEKVREEMILSEDEFKIFYGNIVLNTPEDLRSLPGFVGAAGDYSEYLRYMEVKIYKDLLGDKQAMLAANYFGEDGVKLMLDEDSAVGDRNSRFKDARLSWAQGVNDFEGSFDALTTSEYKIVGGGSIKDGTAFTVKKTQSEIDEDQASLRYRDYLRNEENQILEAQKTFYSSNAKLVDLFGDTALMSEGDLIEDYSAIRSQIDRDIEFSEYILPAVRSMPQSLSGTAIGALTTVATGGNVAAGTAATLSWMHGLVASRTYYDSYLDPKLDGLSESQRKLYSQGMGLAEGLGEAADFYILASGLRAVKGLGVGGKLIERASRGPLARYTGFDFATGKAIERTSVGAVTDFLLNLTATTGINAVGEGVAEGTTGGLQYIMTQMARGEKIDGGELLDRMEHDAKIGMYAGLMMGLGSVSINTAIESTRAALNEEYRDTQAQLRLFTSLIENDKTIGALNEAQARNVREAQKELSRLFEGRDVQLTQDDILAAMKGLVVPNLELTEEEREQMAIIQAGARGALERLGENTQVYKNLIENNRWDIVAEMIERNNLNKFYDWALSFDEREITIDGNGAARTKDGRLATGYGSRMDATLGKISEEQKNQWKKARTDNNFMMRMVQAQARINASMMLGRAIINPYRGQLKTQTESVGSGFIITVDQEGNVSRISPDQLEQLGKNRAGLVDVAAQMAVDAKGEVSLVFHTTRDSFENTTGSTGLGVFMETSQEQRDNGLKDEMHILLDEETSIGDVTRALVHELGHYKFKGLVNDRATRKAFMDAIMSIAQRDEMVGAIVGLVQEEYSNYQEADLEKEIINHVVQAAAVGIVAENGMANILSKVTGAKNLNEADFLIAMQSFVDYIARTTGEYASFSKSEFENAKLHRLGEIEAQESEQLEEESSEVDESQEAMEARPFKKPFTYLQNTELHYDMSVTDYSIRGMDYTKSMPKTVTVKDYNHFRNLYAKLTGNGADPTRMKNIRYEKDGKVYTVKPPKPKIDMRTGEPIAMPVPEYVGWQTREINRRMAVENAQQAIRYERIALQTRLREMYNSSHIKRYSNIEAFYPYEVYSAKSEDVLSYQLMSDIERTNVLKSAVANFEAFLDLNLNEDQIDDIANATVGDFGIKSGWINVKDNLNIFNAANNKYETIREKKQRILEGMERHGVQAWQLLPNDSPARQRRQRNLNLITFEEVDHALMILKNMDRGKPMDSAPMPLEMIKIGSKLKSGRGMPKGHGTPSTDVSANLGQGLNDLELLPSETLFTTHNLDPTRVGLVKFAMEVPGVGVSKFSSANNAVSGLLGGPAGPLSIPGLVHSNTNEQSSKDITGNAAIAAAQGKKYALLFRVLSPENSFNNPLVMKILIDALIQYVDVGGDVAAQNVANVLTSFMGNSYTKNEISVQEIDDFIQGTSEVRETYQTSLPVSYAYDSIVKTGLGIEKKNNVFQVSSEGVISFLRQVQNGADSLGFGGRGAFVSKILQPQGGVSAYGFVSKERFLDAINDPRFKDAKPGDTVAISVVDTSTDEDGNYRFGRTQDVSSFVQGVNKSRVAYNFGVTGRVGFKLLENFASAEQLKIPFASRAKMTKAEYLKSGASLESRRMLGRLHHHGETQWEQSTPTVYGARLAMVARMLQDKYSDVLLLQQDVEDFRGAKVPESQDFEMAMDLFYGKVRTDLERIEAMVDVVNTMAKESGITPEQISDFLYARHAVERNEFIKGRNQMLDSGSGLTNQEAEDILEELDSPEMRLIAKEADKIVAFTRKYMIEGGLEKRSVVEEWVKRFKHYVPLNGLAEDEMDSETNSYPTGGAGMAIYGPTTRKARGRSSKTGVNVFGNIVMQAASVVQRARKDEAMLSLYNLIKSNPNDAVWSVHTPTNRFVSMGQKLSDQAMKAREDVVPIRVNGEQHFIKFRNADFARALNGMTVETLDFTSRQAAKYVGFLRNSYTVWNPAFFIPNFARDFSSALFNAAAEIDREGGILNDLGLNAKDFNKKLMGTTMSTLKVLLQDAHGFKMDPEVASYVEEWKAAGGRTGWSYSDSLNKVVSEMNDKTVGRSKTGEMIGKAWGSSVGAVAEYVEGVNEAFENAVRLASYIEARRAGASKQRSAQLSKNITVNFNKSGELTPSINAWFLFFNAAIQGTSRFARTFATIKESVPQGESKSRMTSAQRMGIGLVMMSYAQTVINTLISGRDDDDELFYKKDIPDYRKQRNFIIMTGERDNVQIPLPYGINLFSNLGTILAEVSLGVRDIDDAAMFLAISTHSSFSPIAFGHGDNLVEGAMSTLAPTFLKPLSEVAFNSTYFGGKVYQEQFPFGTEVPEYTLAFRTPEFIVEMNRYLNEMSGGKEFIPGDMDFNPDPYYYLMLSMLGGAGKFTGDVVDLATTGAAVVSNAINETTDNKGFLQALVETEKPVIRRNDIPFAKIVLAGASNFYDYDLFQENRDEIKQYMVQVKKYAEGEADDVEGLDFRGVQELDAILDDTESVLEELRTLRRDLRESDDIDYIKKQNVLYMIEQEEMKILVYFNAKYYELRGQYVDPRPTGIIPEQTLKQALGLE
jgi:hypothetical protein